MVMIKYASNNNLFNNKCKHVKCMYSYDVIDETIFAPLFPDVARKLCSFGVINAEFGTNGSSHVISCEKYTI